MFFFTLVRGSIGLWLGGIFLLVGLSLLAVSTFQFYTDRQFAQEGRSTQGTVLTKRIRETDDSTSADRRAGRGTSRTKHYELTYRFTAQGETLEGRDELTREHWERLTESGPVEVLYLPRKPSSSRLAGQRPWLMKTMFGLIGPVFALIGAAIFIGAVRHARLETRLRQHGVSVQGTVAELRARKVTVNDVRLWRLHYEYTDFQSQRHVNTIDMPEDEAQQWKVGDVGQVRYDSARPTEAVWLGRDDA